MQCLIQIETISEFVENADILEKSKYSGVGYAQGFAIQHSILADDFLGSL